MASTTTSSARQDWTRLVEEVAGMNSLEPLPKVYKAEDYLPGGVSALPTSLLEQLRAEDGGYDEEAAGLYRSQITLEEGMYAQPTVPRFSSRALQLESVSSGEGSAVMRRKITGALPSREEDTLYQRYRMMLASSGRSAAAAAAGGARPASPTGAPTRGLGGSSSLLTSGFADVAALAATHRKPDFMPIILVPASITAPLQILNIRNFLEHGDYVDPTTVYVNEETGESNVQDTKPESLIVTPGSFLDRDKFNSTFRQFRIVDDPRQIQNWRHVCAAFVEGNEWQFKGWFPREDDTAREPSQLFIRLRGFLPYFEEDKVPVQTQEWRVQSLLLTRRTIKSHQHLLEASRFWEQLYAFLDEDAFFRLYTVAPDE